MKRHCFYGFLSAVVLLAGCNADHEFQLNNAGGNCTLTAVIEDGADAASRTAIGEDGQVLWEENDRMGVFVQGDAKSIPFTLASGAGQVSGNFTGNLPVGGQVSLAYYPYEKNEDATLDGNTLTVTLPTDYAYKGNSYAPMLGTVDGNGNLQFRHLSGLLKIILRDIPEGASRFVIASADKALAGEADIDISAQEPILHLKSQEQKTVTYTLPSETTAEELIFYVPLPVGTYPKLTVSLMQADGVTPFFERTITNQTVKRAVMVEFPVLNGLTGEEYVLSEKAKVVTEEMASKVTLANEESMTLTYSGVEATDIPQEGEIILSRPTEKLPYGLMRKVKSVKQNGTSYTVETEPTALSEAFDKLYVNANVELIPEEGSDAQTRGLLDHIFVDKTYSETIAVKHQEGNATVNGTIDLGGRAIVNIDLDKDKKMDFGTFTLELTLHPTADLNVEYEQERKELVRKKLKELPFMPIKVTEFVYIFPVITPYFVVEGEGKANLYANFDAECRCVLGAQYRNGVWETTRNLGSMANFESSWDVKSGFSISGSAFVGIDNEVALKFYNQDGMKVYFSPKVGGEIEGEVSLDNTMDASHLESTLTEAKLHASLYATGTVGADASLLVPGSLQLQKEIARIVFWEKEISLVPTFKKLAAKVASATTRAAGSYAATVNTEVSGELAMKDVEVGLALVDENDMLVADTQWGYNGGKTYEEQPDVIVPLEKEFQGLQGNSTYKTYPYIVSPAFEDLAEGGKVLLKEQAVDISTGSDEDREALIRLYKASDGENWKVDSLWCSDAPLSEWYGVKTDDAGRVIELNLSNNNLKGIGIISVDYLSKLEKLDVSGNPLTDVSGIMECGNLRSVNLENCTELVYAAFSRGSVTDDINLKGCVNLEELFLLPENKFVTKLDISDCKKLRRLGLNADMDELDLSGYANLEELNAHSSRISSINLAGCTSLKNVFIQNSSVEKLDLSGCSSLYWLQCDGNLLTTLDASDCVQLYTLYCNNNQLISLNVKNCRELTELHCNDNQLKSIDVSDCTQMYKLYCGNNLLTTLDLRGLTQLHEIWSRGNRISKIYLSVSISNLIFVGEQWGVQDKEQYPEPYYHDGYPYPEFVIDLS